MIDHQLKFSTQYSYRIKVLVLGAKNSGKSSFIYTYKHEAAPKHKIYNNQTDVFIKKIRYIKAKQMQHYECNIHLWDTTADESSDFLNNILIKRINAIVLLFDLEDRRSFERMRSIWGQIQDKKSLYHVEVIMIGNRRNKWEQNSLEHSHGHFMRSVSLVDDDYKDQRAIILEDQSFNHRKQRVSVQMDNTQFSKEIQFFKNANQLQYYVLSVKNVVQVRQVFQHLLGKIMKNIQDGKISLNQCIIKDTQGKVRLRKFDYKTYEYFQKRYNKCC